MANPGKLTERIRIEQKGESTDGPFRESTGWSTVATVWANVTPVNAREEVSPDSQTVMAKYKVTIRRRTDITGDMRFIWTSNNDVQMNVRELPTVSPRRQYMEIFVTTGGAD